MPHAPSFPILAIAAALAACAHFWHGWTEFSAWDLGVGATLLAVAGMAGQKTWSEPRAGAIVLLGAVIAAAVRLVTSANPAWNVASLAGCIVLLVWWWRTFSTHRRRPEQPPLVSLVLLLKQAREIDSDALAELAARAFGEHVIALDAASDEASGSEADVNSADAAAGELDHKQESPVTATSSPSVIGEMPYFVLQLRHSMLAVHVWEGPYYEDAADYAHVIDDKVCQAIAEHQAWLSVDLLAGESATNAGDDLQGAFQVVGKLLAELAGEALAVVCPACGQVVSFSPDTPELLRSAKPLELFAGSPKGAPSK